MGYRLGYMVKPYIWLLMLATTLLCACENDLKKIQEISSKETSAPVQRTTGVDVIYSDSAHVKIHMQAPLLMQYTTKNPYDEMPKGVKISFLDSNAVTTSTITSEYGVRRINEKLIELDKNVVATNEKGDVFRSDQLIWDQTTRKVTSKKPVSITSTDGSVIYGSTLVTNEKFDPWDITQTTGKFNVKQNITP